MGKIYKKVMTRFQQQPHTGNVSLDSFTAVGFENSILLRYDSMSLGNWLLTLLRNTMPSQHQEQIMQ
jgi:hypothetical protein